MKERDIHDSLDIMCCCCCYRQSSGYKNNNRGDFGRSERREINGQGLVMMLISSSLGIFLAGSSQVVPREQWILDQRPVQTRNLGKHDRLTHRRGQREALGDYCAWQQSIQPASIQSVRWGRDSFAVRWCGISGPGRSSFLAVLAGGFVDSGGKGASRSRRIL